MKMGQVCVVFISQYNIFIQNLHVIGVTFRKTTTSSILHVYPFKMHTWEIRCILMYMYDYIGCIERKPAKAMSSVPIIHKISSCMGK